MSSLTWPATRSTPDEFRPWKWPLNVYVNVAGKPLSTPVWVAVAVNDPSEAIAMLEMLNEESLKAGAWCAVEAVGVRHRDILDLRAIRRDVEPVSGAGVSREPE